MPLKTIKETRKELARWGNFWRSKEYGSGFSSVSPTARICETLRSECYTEGTAHQVSHLSDNIYEPADVLRVSAIVNKLSGNCRQAILAKYVKKKQVTGYFIDEAERFVMIQLS